MKDQNIANAGQPCSALPTRNQTNLPRILVVEDEPKMARGLQRSLSVDHNVRVASSKRDALAQLRERLVVRGAALPVQKLDHARDARQRRARLA